jgi:hypothetical protein
MKFYQQMLTIVALLFTFMGTASATYYHHDYDHHHGCGGGATPSSCEQTESYSASFSTTEFTKSHSKFYFGFDKITAPGENFELTSAALTITSNSNGWSDSLWVEADPYFWTKIGYISGPGQVTFALSSSLFDEVIEGINFKAWFSLTSEVITAAVLTVEGKYCPPASTPSPVPVPAAAFLFAPALMGFVGLRRKAKKV